MYAGILIVPTMSQGSIYQIKMSAIRFVVLSFMLAQLAFAQFQVIDRANDVRFRSYNKWWNRTKIFRKEVGQIGGWWQLDDPKSFQSQNGNIVGEAVRAVQTQYNPVGFEFHRVVEVSQQVVNGYNYDVIVEFHNPLNETKLYETVIYSAPWQEADQIVSCNPVQAPPAHSNDTSATPHYVDPQRNITNETIVGGWKQVQNNLNVQQNLTTFQQQNNNVIQEAINAVDVKLNETNNTEYHLQEVTNIQTQVVSGINYNVGLRYIDAQNNTITYTVVIYSAPWLGPDQVVSVTPHEVKAAPVVPVVPFVPLVPEGEAEGEEGEDVINQEGLEIDPEAWINDDPTLFQQLNPTIVSKAVQAATTKYTHKLTGFQFRNVNAAEQQNNDNYNVEFDFVDAAGKVQRYQALVYRNPKTNFEQVVSVSNINVDETPEY